MLRINLLVLNKIATRLLAAQVGQVGVENWFSGRQVRLYVFTL